MRLARPLALVALLAGAAVSLPAQAGTTPVLSGTSVVTASRSGYVDVVLPADVRLSPKEKANPDVTVQGSGRMLGVWLRALDPANGDFLETVRRPGFLGGGTTSWASNDSVEKCSGSLVVPDCHVTTPHAFVLRRGRYRLSVLTDGEPVSVTLRLTGLTGRRELRPQHLLASSEHSLPLRETAGDRTITYGLTGPLSGSVLTFVAATATTTGTQLDGWSLCERRDPGEAAPFAYSAACPGGTSGGYDVAVREGTYRVFGTWTGSVDSGQPVGLGGSFTNDGGVKLGQTLGVWLQVV